MTVLAITPMYNTPNTKDDSGAFEPEALAWVRLHGPGSKLDFDNLRAMTDRREEVKRLLQRHAGKGLKAVAFFCHGWRDGIQAGYRLKDVPLLAALLEGCLAPGGVVALYCCDTARDGDVETADDRLPTNTGEGGFAHALASALRDHRVLGHATAGHTTRNPFVLSFLGSGPGVWYCSPRPGPDFNAFGRALREHPTFRLELPFRAPGP